MFSRILFFILLVSILNEACNAERLLGCTKFSDRPLGLPAGAQEVVITLNSDLTDVNFIPVIVPPAFMPAYLILDSCEKGAKSLDVINKTTLKEQANEYKEQITSITIDFGAWENNCIQIADIKSTIEKIVFPQQDVPTLFIDVTKKHSTKKKAIKRLEKGDFLLLDDCKASSGDFADLTKVNDVVRTMIKGVQDAAVLEFSNTTNCRTFLNVAATILEKLTINHSGAKKIPNPIEISFPIPEAKYVRFKDGKFALVSNCESLMSIELDTATKLEDVLDNIADNVIMYFEQMQKTSSD